MVSLERLGLLTQAFANDDSTQELEYQIIMLKVFSNDILYIK